MKREMDLVRLLLIQLEGETEVDFRGYTEDQINYHKALVKEGGYAEGVIHYGSDHISDIPDLAVLDKLTWEGHEFLEQARNNNVWNKAKQIIAEKGLDMSIETLKVAIPLAIKQLLK